MKKVNQPKDQSLHSLHKTADYQTHPSPIIKYLLIFTILILFVLTVFIYLFYNNATSKSLPLIKTNTIAQNQVLPNFFQNRITKSLGLLTVKDFPNTQNIKGVIKYKNNLWLSGDGSVIEFDPVSNSIVSFSDPMKANCDSNLAIIDHFLFVPCRTGFLGPGLSSIPRYRLLKINLDTKQVEYIYTSNDGLKSSDNYQVWPDGKYIWLRTFGGVARINVYTNKIEFLTTQLGLLGTGFEPNEILVDKDYVWVSLIQDNNQRGGLSLYNKKTGVWKAFPPGEINTGNQIFNIEFSSNNANAIKLIPNGLQVGFRNPDDTYIEKQYRYTTNTWTTIHQQPATAIGHEELTKYIDATYPSNNPNVLTDNNGFTQLVAPDTNKQLLLNGRNNAQLSDVINNKRYILTNVSLDEYDGKVNLPKILFGLNKSYGNSPHSLLFSIDKKSSLGYILDTGCGGGDALFICNKLELWLIDFSKDQLVLDYKANSNLKLNDTLTFSSDSQNDYFKNSKGEVILTINKITHEVTIISN